LSIIRNGSPERVSESGQDQTKAPESAARTIPRSILLLAVAALILAVFVGTQVLGVLFAIVFPPIPPVPDDAIQVSYASTGIDVDEWVYTSDSNVCEIVEFYQARSDVCRLLPFSCVDRPGGSDAPLAGGSAAGQHIGRCLGTTSFSLFAMRWQVIIGTGRAPGASAEFRLVREIFWSGAIPPLSEY
jgi:hypothetical protein